jgi:hypothetical protein
MNEPNTPAIDTLPYSGEHLHVRRIHKRDGTTAYGVHRPGRPNAILDQFDSLREANLIAIFIDQHGGDYSARYRRAAKQHAKAHLSN